MEHYLNPDNEKFLIHGLRIANNLSYLKYKNKLDVILINMQEFLRLSGSIESMLNM